MHFPDKKQFIKLARKGNLIPVYREIFADLETPVSAFLKLSKGKDYAYLLESVEGEEKFARFSFLATDPKLIFQSKGKNIEIMDLGSAAPKIKKYTCAADPLSEIQKLMSGFKAVSISGLPRFIGGLVGYMGYDTVRFYEKLPQKNPDELKLADMMFMLSESLVIFDHINHKIKVVCCCHVERRKNAAKIYDCAIRKIDKLVKAIEASEKLEAFEAPQYNLKPRFSSNFSKKTFMSIVSKAKEYIRKGDIIQAVLSQRFKMRLPSSAFNAYRILRSINPSPYMYYLKFKNLYIVGSSPELLVRCEDGVVETCPIAGTRRRGRNEAEDSALEKDLLSDIKEKAEHIMLVDLGRNDLGRVCVSGSVKVTDFMRVERYSHVMHLVSNVIGRLANGKNIYDVVRATFPAGTVTGAPKVRAMEIIEELENTRRGIYAGSVGYFSFSGNLDTCITIRTIVVQGNTAYIQAGAGIVQDSKPAKEYEESLNKARAQICALQSKRK
ncbi:MAG: anthranilate synthase component I [Candidatus Omnitrophota bacterium]|nr:anthranilate synthase component I [Candidatus Omnitrophota bacterium]